MQVTEITVPVQIAGPGAVSSMPATLLRPDGPADENVGERAGGASGIVLVQEIFGRTEYLQSRAADLVALGHTVLVPQVYWRSGRDTIDETTPEGLGEAVELMQATDWDRAVHDIGQSVAALRRDPATGGLVALVGFCFGGGLAYASMQTAQGGERADVLVSYYGSALPMLVDGDPVIAHSLHHFGTDDAYLDSATVAHISEVVEANGATVHLWPGAGHAFDNPSPMFHHAEASQQAWQVTEAWLAENFPA